MGLGGKIATGLFFVVLAMGGVGYWYYNNSQETITILNQNNARLETAVDLNEQAIQTLNSEYGRAVEEMQALNQDLASARERNDFLVQKLEEHDLGYLASEKPGLVENIINNASDNAARCFEIMSGSPLTETEKNARNALEFNSECPWLWSNAQ